jgi:hypothetical protein
MQRAAPSSRELRKLVLPQNEPAAIFSDSAIYILFTSLRQLWCWRCNVVCLTFISPNSSANHCPAIVTALFRYSRLNTWTSHEGPITTVLGLPLPTTCQEMLPLRHGDRKTNTPHIDACRAVGSLVTDGDRNTSSSSHSCHFCSGVLWYDVYRLNFCVPGGKIYKLDSPQFVLAIFLFPPQYLPFSYHICH